MPMARHAPWPAPSSRMRRDRIVRERRRAHRRVKQIVEAGRADVGRYANAAGARRLRRRDRIPATRSGAAKRRPATESTRVKKKYKAVGGTRLDVPIA